MPVRKADTFVETVDTALQSHVPTGPDAGTAWGIAVGALLVIAASGEARDNNVAAGNRGGMNNDLGSSQMNVSLDVRFVNAVVGNLLFAGPTGRAASATAIASYEFDYEWNTGVNGSWVLSGSPGSSSLDEAWPGGTVTMNLQCRANDHRGFANGVEKVRLTSNFGPSNNYAGILLGNFTGDTAKRCFGDNFSADNREVAVAPAGQVAASGFVGRQYV